MAEPWKLRPMDANDVEAVMAVVDAADAEAARRRGESPRPRTPDQVAITRQGHLRFVERDAPGAWVAERSGTVIGVAESIRRGDFWGLSMLFIDPRSQSQGVGRMLLEAASAYGSGATMRMIQSSSDPRALRLYFTAGLEMHPAAGLSGAPDRRAIPRRLGGREGDASDLELVAAVEGSIGRSRAEDVAAGLHAGNRLDVVDDGGQRGWMLWHPGRLIMLGATDNETASTLLWRYLAGADGEASLNGLTAAQNWALAVAHAARVTVQVMGAMFVDGMDVPGPWIPSGWYF